MAAFDALGGSSGLDSVAHGVLMEGGLFALSLSSVHTNQVTSSARLDLPVPAGALIEAARFEAVVDAPGRAKFGDVATVRPVNPGSDGKATEFVVDFRSLQTVSEIDTGLLGVRVSGVFPWLGTEFDAGLPVTSSLDGTNVRFSEIQSERLRLLVQSAVPPSVIEQYSVLLPSPPAAVEILINGVRTWFAPIGAAAPVSLDGGATRHSFADIIDLTRPLQLALDADGSVDVELRTTSPAQLSFRTAPLSFFRTHDVAFADGPTRTFEAPHEGLYTIDLPLPADPTTGAWRIHAVELSVRADIGDVRVQPSVGPVLADDAELILDDTRTLLVKLPAASVSRFGTITGVRIPVSAGAGGGELSGELLEDDRTTTPSRPGEALPNGALAAANVPAEASFAYLSMTVAKPYEPEPDAGALWAAVRATRGTISWALSNATPASLDDAAELRWRSPSGSARRLSEFQRSGVDGTASGYTGAVRIVGTSDRNRPIDAVTVQVDGRAAYFSLTPFDTGSAARLDIGPPVTPLEHSGTGPPWVVRCLFSISAPGTYTIASARLIYVDPSLDAAFEPGGAP